MESLHESLANLLLIVAGAHAVAALVASLHDTNGRWDPLAELHAVSIAELSEILERVRTIKGIETTEASIHLQTFCRAQS